MHSPATPVLTAGASVSATFERLISRIDTVSGTERLKWSVWHCRNCNVSGQNKRLSPEGRFPDRYTNTIVIVIILSMTRPVSVDCSVKCIHFKSVNFICAPCFKDVADMSHHVVQNVVLIQEVAQRVVERVSCVIHCEHGLWRNERYSIWRLFNAQGDIVNVQVQRPLR